MEIHLNIEEIITSFSLSVVSESIDFHWAYRLSPSLSIFSAYRVSQCLSIVSEPFDFHRVYCLSPSLAVFQWANRWPPSPSIFSAHKCSVRLSMFYDPIDFHSVYRLSQLIGFHRAYRLSVSLHWVSIVSETIDLLSSSIFKEHFYSLWAYGFSLSLSIFSKPIVFLAYRF